MNKQSTGITERKCKKAQTADSSRSSVAIKLPTVTIHCALPVLNSKSNNKFENKQWLTNISQVKA